METQAVEQGSNAGARILARFVEDAVDKRGLGNLLFRGQADFRFKIWIGGHQKAGGAGIDLRLLVIDARGEHLRVGESNVNGIALHRNIAGLELAQIHAGGHFAMSHEEQFVADQNVGNVRSLALAAHNFIERINDGLETRQLSNFLNHRRG